MRQKLKTGAFFAALVVAGALAASAVAGMGPMRVTQSSSSVSTTTTTASTTTTTTSTTTTTTPRRLTICHHAKGKKGGAVKHVTITISRNAWKAHQRHGDSMGACNTTSARKFHNKAGHKAKFHKRPR